MGSQKKLSNSRSIYYSTHHSLTSMIIVKLWANWEPRVFFTHFHNHHSPSLPKDLVQWLPHSDNELLLTTAASLCHGDIKQFTFRFHSNNHFARQIYYLYLRKLRPREVSWLDEVRVLQQYWSLLLRRLIQSLFWVPMSVSIHEGLTLTLHPGFDSDFCSQASWAAWGIQCFSLTLLLYQSWPCLLALMDASKPSRKN